MKIPQPEGFSDLPCIKCGEDGSIAIRLDTLSDFWCPECDSEYSLEDVVAVLDGWERVVRWLAESRPTRTE